MRSLIETNTSTINEDEDQSEEKWKSEFARYVVVDVRARLRRKSNFFRNTLIATIWSTSIRRSEFFDFSSNTAKFWTRENRPADWRARVNWEKKKWKMLIEILWAGKWNEMKWKVLFAPKSQIHCREPPHERFQSDEKQTKRKKLIWIIFLDYRNEWGKLNFSNLSCGSFDCWFRVIEHWAGIPAHCTHNWTTD